MSTTIDNRVVEMQFDNRHFEKNVATSMSTLDKLKKSLNLTGAAKGLDSVTSAAKRVDLSSVSRSADTVGLRFNALYTVADQALRNITTSAMNAGKRIVDALTIDPIKTGFNEYELKMGSIQTIMASTGESLETVNEYLNELNKYSDKTIYSFSDMTQNIGKFTNAGVKLEDAVMAIKGISNEAAVSGANANEASRAMYNFAQALSAGYVKLIDWKSIELANMATVEFKNQLIATALELGTIVEKEGKYITTTTDANGSVSDLFDSTKNFNESLSHQWMTTDVLVKTLGKYADETTEIGKKSYAAAQDVKTLSQLFDTLKEAAQSGWAQTWELIVGDFEEAKNLFTTLSKSIGGFIDKMSESRNELLGGALDSKWTQLIKKINDAGVSTEDFETAVKHVLTDSGIHVDAMIEKYGTLENAFASGNLSSNYLVQALKNIASVAEDGGSKLGDLSTKLEYYQEVVDKVWHGDYDIMEERKRLLKEAGYNAEYVQKLVNKSVQDGEVRKLTIDDLTEAYNELSDSELKSIGYTEEEIKALRELAKQAEETGTPVSELIASISKRDGRTLLFEAFGNAFSGLKTVITQIGAAWSNTFKGIQSHHIYNVIEAINKLSQHLIVGDETAENVFKTFKGLFAILDLVTTIAGGGLKIAFKTLTTILGYFDMDILDVTAHIGDAIVGFRDWLEPMLDVTNVLENIPGFVSEAVKAIKGWISSIGEKINLPPFITDMLDAIGNWADSLKDSENIPRDIIMGIVLGLKKGAKEVWDGAVKLATELWEGFCEFLGIHSPARKFIEAGLNIIQGLIQGIGTGAVKVWNAMKELGSKMLEAIENSDVAAGLTRFKDFVKDIFGKLVEFLSGIDLGALFAAALGVGMLYTVNKVVGVLEMFAKPLTSFSDLMDSAKDTFEALTDRLKGNTSKFQSFADNLLTIAKAIGILAVSLFLVASIPAEDLQGAMVAIGLLAGLIAAMAFAAQKMDKLDVSIQTGSVSMIAFAGSLLIMAIALKQMSTIDTDKVLTVLAVLGGIVVGLSVFVGVFGKFVKANVAANMAKAGVMLLLMAHAMLIMVNVVKAAAGLKAEDAIKGLAVVAAIELLFMAIVGISKNAGKHGAKAGLMILMMSAAFVAMIGIIALASKLDGRTVAKGITVVGLIGILFAALIKSTKRSGKNAAKAGVMLLGMSVALAIAVTVIKQVSKLDGKAILKGLAVVAAIEVLFAGLIAVTKYAGKHAMKAGVMLLAMSGALLVLTGVLFILTKLDPQGLYRALGVVTVLELLFIGLIAVTKYAKKVTGTLVVMTVAIGLLSVALFMLSYLDPNSLKAPVIALTSLITAFALLVAATKFMKNSKSMQKTLLTLIGVIAVLSGIIWALSLIDPTNVLPNVAALSTLLLIFSGSMAILGTIGRISTTVQKPMATMLLVVAALTGVIWALSEMNPATALPNALALSTLLVAYSASIALLGTAGKISTTVQKPMAAMLIVVAALTGVIWALSEMNPESVLPNVLSLSALLLAFSTSMVILSAAGKMSSTVIKPLAAMGLVVAEIAAILGIMQALDITASIEQAASLSTLLLAMSAACAIVSLIPASAAITGAAGLAAFIGIMATVVAAAGALAQIPGFKEIVADGGEMLGLVGYALGNFVGSIAGGVIAGVSSGLPELGKNLSAFMTNITPFIEGVRTVDGSVLAGTGYLAGAIAVLAVAELIAGIAAILTLGCTFSDLGTELSNFMTNAAPFIDGASSLDANVLSGTATLASVILTLSAAGVVDGLVRLFGGGKSSLSSFGEQLPGLGTNLKAFSTNLGTFSDAQVTAFGCAADAIVKLAEAANKIPNEGGWAAKILGENSIATFGAYLPALGTNLATFVKNLGTFTEAQVNTVTCAADAITSLATAADALPNEGGWAAKILGDNSIATFGSYLPALGTNLASFVKNLGTFTDAQVTTVGCASDAIVKMADAASKIPNEGGWAAKILGDNSLATFGNQLPALGTNLASFVKNLGTFTDAQVATVDAAGKAIVAMATASASIDGQAEWAKKIFGDNSLSKFGTEMAETGKSIAAFVKNLGTFGDDKITTVTNAVRAINAFTALANADLKNAKTNLSGFGDKLPDFATNIASFATTMGNVGASVTTAVSTVNKLLGMIKDIAAANVGAMKTFASSLKTLGGDAVNKFITAFTSETAKTNVKTALTNLMAKAVEGIKSKEKDVKTAGENIAKKAIEGVKAKESDAKTSGENLIKKVAEGVKSKEKDVKTAGENLGKQVADGVKAKESDVKTAAEKVASAGATKIEADYSDWKDAGKYLVKGFAAGITAQTFQAEAKAAAMARAALNAAEEELDINSPSKEGIRIGNFFGMGFVNTIGDWADRAYSASAEMADYAKTGLSNAIGKVRDVIENDMDTQPTIRPVLDLSAVEAGAGTIGGLFGNSSVGVLANVRGISSMMNQNRQNGVNDDVVYELKKLRGELGNVGGTQYNINGVTYDDGSNITDAVKTIVRAARIERRV